MRSAFTLKAVKLKDQLGHVIDLITFRSCFLKILLSQKTTCLCLNLRVLERDGGFWHCSLGTLKVFKKLALLSLEDRRGFLCHEFHLNAE